MKTRARSMILGSLVAGVLASALVIVPGARAADTCFPACRAGYLCSPSGTCVSACNPPCPETLECSSALTCVAKGTGGGAAAPSPVPPSAGYPPPQQPSPGYPPQPASGYPQQPAGGYPGAPPPSAGYPNADPNAAPSSSGYPAAAGAPAVIGLTGPPVAHNPFLALPFVGFESFQNDTLPAEGLGLRLGFIGGGRLSEMVSINGEAVIDVSHLKDEPTSVSESEYTFQLSFAPLLHLVPPGTPIEVAVGPKVGFFRTADSATEYGVSQSATVLGLLLGVNVAGFGRISDSLALGAIFSFDGEKATSCSLSSSYSCTTDNAPWFKVISFSVAALF